MQDFIGKSSHTYTLVNLSKKLKKVTH